MPTSMSSQAPPPLLPGLRLRRSELHAALVALENAAARPISGRARDWMRETAVKVDALRDCLGRHVDGAEGEGGLYDEVLASAPAMDVEIHRLRAEHATLCRSVNEVSRTLRSAASDDEDLARQARERVSALVAAVSRHRQAGADLVYEVFQHDLGDGG